MHALNPSIQYTNMYKNINITTNMILIRLSIFCSILIYTKYVCLSVYVCVCLFELYVIEYFKGVFCILTLHTGNYSMYTVLDYVHELMFSCIIQKLHAQLYIRSRLKLIDFFSHCLMITHGVFVYICILFYAKKYWTSCFQKLTISQVKILPSIKLWLWKDLLRS